MKKFIYTKTALASLLTLCSLNSFAVDEEIKKLDTSLEVIKTSNRKLREKMDRICNTVPKKKETKGFVHKIEDTANTVGDRVSKVTKDIGDKASDVAQATKNKASEMTQSVQNKTADIAQVTKNKASEVAQTVKNKADDMAKVTGLKKRNDDDKYKNDDDKYKKDKKDNKDKRNDLVKISSKEVTNKNINDNAKNANNQANENVIKDSDLKLTFGGTLESQGYYKTGSQNDTYKYDNVMQGKKTGTIGDYSEDIGTSTDAVVHLRAESKNEDLSIAYGANVQFHIPVAKGKGEIYGIHAIRGKGAHVFLNTKYVDVKVGYQFGPEALMRLDATRIAIVNGAADSDWFKKVNLEGKNGDFPFYVTPRLYTESLSSGNAKFAYKEMSNKNFTNTLPFRIAVYSQNYKGLRLGFSYSPRYEQNLFDIQNNEERKYLRPWNPGDLNFDDPKSEGSRIYNKIVDSIVEKGKLKQDKAITKEDISKAFTDAGVELEKVKSDAALKSTDKKMIDVSTKLASHIKNNYAIKQDEINISDIMGKYNITVRNKNQDDLQSVANSSIVELDEKQIKQSILDKLTVHDDKKISNPNDIENNFLDAAKQVLSEHQKSDKRSELTSNSSNKQTIQDLVIDIQHTGVFNAPDLQSLIHSGPSYENIVSAGASYEYYFNENIRVKAAGVFEYGKPKKPDAGKHTYSKYTKYNDLLGFNIGGNLDYKISDDCSIRVAGSFANLNKSGQPKSILELHDNEYKERLDSKDSLKSYDNDTTYWTVGIGGQYQSSYASATIFHSTMNDGDKLTDYSLGVQYDLSTAESKTKCIPYIAGHYFTTEEDTKNKSTAANNEVKEYNSGSFIAAGVKFIF